MEAYKVRVYGRIQRVGFRGQILDLAQELMLSGNAKNMSDGSIEIFVQGEKEQLTKFFERLEQPMPPAKITGNKKGRGKSKPRNKRVQNCLWRARRRTPRRIWSNANNIRRLPKRIQRL
ncbi:MAG: acylphosphatase [Candidatus Bathyarchaeia archaeon]